MQVRHLTILVTFLLLSALPASAANGETLALTADQLYRLASYQGEEKDTLLTDLREGNPGSSLRDLDRRGAAIRLYFSAGEYLEILNNELYSLASYVPAGLDRKISRRSSPNMHLAGIEKVGAGIVFRIGATATGRLVTKRPPASARRTPSPSTPASVAPAASLPPPAPEQPAAVKPEPVAVKPPTVKKPAAGPRPRKVRRRKPVSAAAAVEVKASGVMEVQVAPADASLPLVDGLSDDEAWARTRRTSVSIKGLKQGLDVAAVEGEGRLFMLFIWADRNPASDYRRWYWDAGGKSYRRSREMDDGLAVRWLVEGRITPDLRSGDVGSFDTWVWRAGREGLGRYASDKRVQISDTPVQLAKYFTSPGGKGIWLKQEYDQGQLPFSIVIPQQYEGDRVNSIASQDPDGSAADVRAAGRWKDGLWTVEMSRRLSTGNQDDLNIAGKGAVSFVVSLLERKEIDAAPHSGVLTLKRQ